MTITRIGNQKYNVSSPNAVLTTTATKTYYTLSGHKSVKLVVQNTGTNNITVTSVKCWSDPESPMGRVSVLPTADAVDTISFTSPVVINTAETENIPDANSYTHMEVDVEAVVSVASTGTITLATALAGDIVTVNGLTYTAVTGAKSDNTEFSIDGSDTVDATDLADSITNDTRTPVTVPTIDVTAIGASAVVTVTASVLGTGGNAIDLAEDTAGARITLSGALLTGGTGNSASTTTGSVYLVGRVPH